MSDPQRQAAIDRIKAKRAFQANVVSFVVIGALFVVIWLVSGAGYFWPIWILGFWAVGLAVHGWSVYGQRGITEEDVQREMRHGGSDVVD